MAVTTRQEQDESAGGVEERLALISSQLAVQGEQIRAILGLLTAERASNGPSLAKQMGDLIDRLDNQTDYLKDLAVAVGKLGRDLPLDLVAAIDDNLDIPRRREGNPDGNGTDRP